MNHLLSNEPKNDLFLQDNSDSSSTGSGSYGSATRPQNFPMGGQNDLGKTSSPLAFQHEYQNSTGSSKSFTDRLRSSFTKQGKVSSLVSQNEEGTYTVWALLSNSSTVIVGLLSKINRAPTRSFCLFGLEKKTVFLSLLF